MNVRDLLVCVVGHSLCGIYLSGFMSRVMPTPQRGLQSVGNSDPQQPSVIELRAVYFCKDILLNSCPCSIAHQLGKY